MEKRQLQPQGESEFAAQVAGKIAALEQEQAALTAQIAPLQAALEALTTQIAGLRGYLAPVPTVSRQRKISLIDKIHAVLQSAPQGDTPRHVTKIIQRDDADVTYATIAQCLWRNPQVFQPVGRGRYRLPVAADGQGITDGEA